MTGRSLACRRKAPVNVTEALSSAAVLEHVGLAEALELCLLLAEKDRQRFGRAAVRGHGRQPMNLTGSY
jgi:hypothetical protein